MRVLVHHRASVGFEATLRRAATTACSVEGRAPHAFELEFVPEDEGALFAERLPHADAILHVLEPLERAALARAERLLLVQKVGVGVNTIDVASCQEFGIGVANMPGTNTQAVAEHTLALLLAVLRRIPALDHETRRGRGFPVDPELLDTAGEVAGRTVGLVGWGAVAERLAPVLVALGAHVVVATRNAARVAHHPVMTLDALLERADVVSLHLPLTPETRGLLTRERLFAMKPRSVLLNTSRGGLVDPIALAEALTRGPLRAAGLDVFADEPVPNDEPLLGLRNVVLTPHIAWRTPETLERSFAVALTNCARAMEGQSLVHEIAPVRRRAAPRD